MTKKEKKGIMEFIKEKIGFAIIVTVTTLTFSILQHILYVVKTGHYVSTELTLFITTTSIIIALLGYVIVKHVW